MAVGRSQRRGYLGEEEGRGDVHKELINNGQERVHAEGTGVGALMGKLLLLVKYEPENRLWEKTKAQPFFLEGGWGRQKIVHIEMNT